MHNLIGQSLGRYNIIAKLGEGGMAEVFKAYDTKLKREVAIKIIRPEKGTSDKFLKRFEREAKALATLNHKSIIPIIDYGDLDGIPMLVMPYLPNGTLKQKMGNPIHFTEAAKFLAPIADALAYAHAHGIVHRDVKPTNILLSANDEPMLSDFGIAKLLEQEETVDLTGTGMGVGTPEYMSPEQTMSRNVDGRSDGYSLGVVFYEMITGRKPYQGDTPLAVAIKQNTEPLLNPRKLNPQIPEQVNQILQKVLAKDPEERYQTLGEFQQVLLELSAGKFPAVSKKTGKPNRNINKKLIVSLSVPIISLIVVGAFLLSDKNVVDPIPPTERLLPTVSQAVTPSFIPSKTVMLPTSTSSIIPTPTIGPGSTQISIIDGMEMIYIPAGEYLMGSQPGVGDSDEQPLHSVYVDAFWIDKTEVTNAMYKKCYDAGFCSWNGDYDAFSSKTREKYFDNPKYADYPVLKMYYENAVEYCSWAGRRLPSEAEWEKAAKGPDNSYYPWDNSTPDSTLANFNGNVNDTTAVGTYPKGASIYGVMDMSGNVWEWVSDKYESSYYQKSPPSNPQGPINSNLYEHVLRGGSFLSNVNAIRNTERSMLDYGSRNDVGFRCASTIDRIIPTPTPIIATPTLIPGIGKTKDSAKDGMKLIFVPEGNFLMGSILNGMESSINDLYSYRYFDNMDDETPQHSVYLNAFWIDQTEITNRMFLNFVNETNYRTDAEKNGSVYWRTPSGPSSGLGGIMDHPVVHISWKDAQTYCEWVGRRLPTEAEWEKAARGVDGAIYPWGNESPALSLANYKLTDNSSRYYANLINGTTAVGSYPDGASPYGILDMAGNVSEWVADYYDDAYYKSSPSENPRGPDSGFPKVIKGGSWAEYAIFIRSASRVENFNSTTDALGFRCAMDAN